MEDRVTNNSSDGEDKKLSIPQWKRPPGPPNVWKIIDAEEKLDDNTTRRVRLSIQEIPKDRYEDALDHMCKYFFADTVAFRCLTPEETTSAMQEARFFWNYFLNLDTTIGIFELDSNNQLGELVGLNLLYVATDEIDNDLKFMMMNCRSPKMKNIITSAFKVWGKMDVRKIYGVDKYIAAVGMSLKRSYRGQNLGQRLFEVRAEVGRKYGVTATSTICTGHSSQISSERAGMETVLCVKYEELVDENGKMMFPGMEGETVKVMIMRL